MSCDPTFKIYHTCPYGGIRQKITKGRCAFGAHVPRYLYQHRPFLYAQLPNRHSTLTAEPEASWCPHTSFPLQARDHRPSPSIGWPADIAAMPPLLPVTSAEPVVPSSASGHSLPVSGEPGSGSVHPATSLGRQTSHSQSGPGYRVLEKLIANLTLPQFSRV